MTNLQTIKENIQDMRERDTDLTNCIRKLPKQAKIDTCSHTLDTLVKQLQTSLDNESSFKDKIQQKSKRIFHLEQKLSEAKAQN